MQSDATTARIDQLQNQLSQLQLKASDLQVKRDLIQDQRNRTSGAERAKFDSDWAEVQHDYSAAMIGLDGLHAKLKDLRSARDAQSTIHDAQAMIAVQPHTQLLDRGMVEGIATGTFFLLLPLAFALARRVWIRGTPSRATAGDLESSPRLQRMEQAIESIAIEVERIGEAQRFSAKLMSERQPERIAQAPKREVGSITPH